MEMIKKIFIVVSFVVVVGLCFFSLFGVLNGLSTEILSGIGKLHLVSVKF